MSQTAQVTDIYKFGDMYAEYRVSWQGDWRNFPDLASFPQVPGATVTFISHSPEVDELWAKSEVLCCGADSHIRLLDKGPPSEEEQFLVCKRRCIVDEFEILRGLGSNAVPAVRVHPELLDTAINNRKLLRCLKQIYEEGIVHNDFHPMNVMMKRKGQLVVIDFARSGRVGSKIPIEKRSLWW
ncbi:hypothetical protein V8F33_012940 [Rhypophila sp. PSN 637]